MRVVRSQGQITHQAFAFVVQVLDSLLRIIRVGFASLKVMTFHAKPHGRAVIFVARPLPETIRLRRQGRRAIPAERVRIILGFGRHRFNHDPKRGCRYLFSWSPSVAMPALRTVCSQSGGARFAHDVHAHGLHALCALRAKHPHWSSHHSSNSVSRLRLGLPHHSGVSPLGHCAKPAFSRR